MKIESCMNIMTPSSTSAVIITSATELFVTDIIVQTLTVSDLISNVSVNWALQLWMLLGGTICQSSLTSSTPSSLFSGRSSPISPLSTWCTMEDFRLLSGLVLR